jgi:hypothetical protein
MLYDTVHALCITFYTILQRPASNQAHLQAIITCQSPDLARAAAAFRPRPEEAPVMTTVGFRFVNLLLVEAAAGAFTFSAVDAARQTTREACRSARGQAKAVRSAESSRWGQCEHMRLHASTHVLEEL